MKKTPCKICKGTTESMFNINFKLVHICERCATTIFVQQAQWYAKGLSESEDRARDQNRRMREWFEARTGLIDEDCLLSEHMKEIDRRLGENDK